MKAPFWRHRSSADQETTWPSLSEAEGGCCWGPRWPAWAFDSLRRELGRYGQLSSGRGACSRENTSIGDCISTMW